MNQTLNLKQLYYLCVLARTGNYHSAAQELYVTQPALSMAIKNLETSLGTRLLVRNARGVVPTAAGRLTLDYARRLLDLQQELYQRLTPLQQPADQSLRFGTYLILYSLLIPPFIKKVHQDHPQLDVTTLHMHYTALEKALQKNTLDLILCVQADTNPLFDTIPLRQEHLLVALSPEHPACAKAQKFPCLPYPYLDIRELRQEPFYLQFAHQQIRWQEDKLWEQAGFKPQRYKEIDSIELSVRLASEGLGAAFTMESYIKTLHILKPIRYFVTGDTQKCPWLSLCTARGHSRLPRIQECIRILKDLIQKI